MAKLKRLLDIYRFPGFVPRPKVRGIFGDPRAVVITLLGCIAQPHLSNRACVKPENANGRQPASELGSVA